MNTSGNALSCKNIAVLSRELFRLTVRASLDQLASRPLFTISLPQPTGRMESVTLIPRRRVRLEATGVIHGNGVLDQQPNRRSPDAVVCASRA